MAVSPDTIKRFLDHEPYPLPDFKHMTEGKLHDHIRTITGHAYKPKTEPYFHQLVGVAAGLHAHRILWYYEMRTGKTKTALDWARHLRVCGTFRKKGLVIVPFPLAVGEFVADAEIHSDFKVVGTHNSLDELVTAAESDADMIVLSWHGMRAMFTDRTKVTKKDKTKNILIPNKEALTTLATYFDLIVVDEVHECNNTDSMRFAMAEMLVRNAHYRAGMSGTPINRDKFTIWASTYLIDDGKTLGRSEFIFRSAFGKRVKEFWAPSGFKTVFDDDKTDALLRRLSAVSISYELAETRIVNVEAGTVVVDMLPEQRARYKSVIDGVIERSKIDALERENVFIKLRQISSGFMPFIDDEGKQLVIHFESGKMRWLEDFVSGLPADFPFVIFYEFTESGKAIDSLLTRKHVKHSWLWSGTKDKTKALHDFQQGRTSALLANTRSAWGAVDLQRADYQLFFESTTSPIMRKQVEFRALGPARGDRTLFLDDLVSSATEKRILRFIREGKDAMQEVAFGREAWKNLLL